MRPIEGADGTILSQSQRHQLIFLTWFLGSKQVIPLRAAEEGRKACPGRSNMRYGPEYQGRLPQGAAKEAARTLRAMALNCSAGAIRSAWCSCSMPGASWRLGVRSHIVSGGEP